MNFCVNIHAPEFKETAKRLDISEGQLDNILHEYFNKYYVEGTEQRYPSDAYILNKTIGKRNYNATQSEIEVWKAKYSTPQTFNSRAEFIKAKTKAMDFFPAESIGVRETADDKYVMTIAEPFDSKAYQEEISAIKEKAQQDGTFMKAPNGNPTNLTEQQWLQVRTKAFKEWFGDWENNPENASKAIDENGEPQVFYHGTGTIFDTFDLRFFGQTNYGDRGVGFYFAYNEKNARPYGNIIMPVFLNIRTPFNGSNHYDAYINRGKTRQQIVEDTKEFILSQAERTIGWMIDQRNSGNTSAYFDENFSKDSTNEEIRDKVLSEANSLINGLSEEIGNLDVTDGYLKGSYEALVTRPNQIKSATENIGTFAEEEDNIYHHLSDAVKLESAIREAEYRLIQAKSDAHGWRIIREVNQKYGVNLSGGWSKYTGKFSLNTNQLDKLRKEVFEESSSREDLNKTLNLLRSKIHGVGFRVIGHTSTQYDSKFGYGSKVSVEYDSSTNSYVINYRTDSLPNKVQLAEEMLHPLMYTFQKNNQDIFLRFYDEVIKSKQYSSLVKDIRRK